MRIDYTDEHKRMIERNVNEIVRMIELYMQPRIYGSILVYFASDYMSIRIDKNNIVGFSYGDKIDFYDFKVEYINADYFVCLMRNWKGIKKEIIDQINEQHDTINFIKNFEA